MRKVGVSDSAAGEHLETMIGVYQSHLDAHKMRFDEAASTLGVESAIRDCSERVAQYDEVLRVLKEAQAGGGNYTAFLRGAAINASEALRNFDTPRWKHLAFSMILQTLSECSAMEAAEG